MVSFKTLLCLLALGFIAVLAETKVYTEKMRIKESQVYPGDILPGFLFLQGTVEGGSAASVTSATIGGGRGTLRPSKPDDTAPPEVWDGILDDVRSPQLPYLSQNQWGCEQEDYDMDVVVMESDSIKLTISGPIGGKIWSAYDKINKRDMVMNSRVHQPVNIGSLKAWAPGGIEFNWSPGIIGHAAFSEAPLHVAKIPTEKGDMVRVWEFDRYNATAYQVDILLDDDEFYIHPTIVNPTNEDLRGYWWTCAAFTVTSGYRMITPADRVISTEVGALRLAPWPEVGGSWNNTWGGRAEDNYPWFIDHSFVGNIAWGDFFTMIPADTPRFIIGVEEEDAYGLMHYHKLPGTKIFSWGNNAPGRFMQRLMAGRDNGDGLYVELQTGPVPTQMQNWPLPKNSIKQWTEVFKPWMPSAEEKEKLQGKSYDVALDTTFAWMKSEKGINTDKFAEVDKFFEKVAKTPIKKENILYEGSSWGYVNTKVRAKQGLEPSVFPGMTFNPVARDADEVRPWISLLDNGVFDTESLRNTPSSYQVSDFWKKQIEESASKTGATWLHFLHLGVIAAENGLVKQATIYFNQSMSLKPTAVAARCLAIHCAKGDITCAYQHYRRAWALAITNTKDANRDRVLHNLGAEIAGFLQFTSINDDARFHAYLSDFIGEVLDTTDIPDRLVNSDQFLTSLVTKHLNEKQTAKAIEILKNNCFPTYGRARIDLITFWHNANLIAKEVELKRPLNRAEQRDIRVENPQPRNIGCPYASTYCTGYW